MRPSVGDGLVVQGDEVGQRRQAMVRQQLVDDARDVGPDAWNLLEPFGDVGT